MKKIGLDKFRVISAILIVAIHTFPLLSVNEMLDFIFTHVICRIGVPFFLMVTGFFTLPKAISGGKKNLFKYTLRILKIYLICIIIYLPVNLYAGQLKNIGIIEILKLVFIDGTFYHLWYFPALILGIWITYFLLKHFKKQTVRNMCNHIIYNRAFWR
ncbi:MAG: acyltransferase family protein [Clostridia bacterium]|nr:acyltransferase family protein [Clostridia bacterium]